MQYIRKGSERGQVNLGWLQSQHSFSFGHYFDANHRGFSVLRVINDDMVQPGRGFDTHGHRNMEIISYVISGALKHQDSTGNDYIVPAGDIQVMSAGKGIKHSEFNPSESDPVNFLQIWIEPNLDDVQPSYSQKTIDDEQGLVLLVSEEGENGSLKINQNARISQLSLNKGNTQGLSTHTGAGYLHIVSGEVTVSDSKDDSMNKLVSGDAIGLTSEQHALVLANTQALALWFELPPLN